ncbi:MAG: NifU family protein [Candidatus Omnitrophica bacterium]|nr:NifU family protein [Candidatus Omnitrophota bacterium]
MDIQVMIQPTPNPHAMKFVVNSPVKTEGTVTYSQAEDCQDNPLARAVFESDAHIKELYFNDNYITVTQDGTSDWGKLEEQVKAVLLERLPGHNPNFVSVSPTTVQPEGSSDRTELDKINAILNETIRPALQMHGGDLQVLALKDNVLSIHYQGACGSCPSAASGTLNAIRNILIDQYRPDIEVVMN